MSEHTELTEFLLFPKLPAEIRIMIWKFAAKRSRRIVRIVKNPTPDQSSQIYQAIASIDSPENIPFAPLHKVNKESRTEALKMNEILNQDYPRLFVENSVVGSVSFRFDGVRLNPKMDVLMLDMYAAGYLADYFENDLRELRYIAIYEHDIQFSSKRDKDPIKRDGDLGRMCELYRKLVGTKRSVKPHRFTNLKGIYLILNDEVPGELPDGLTLEEVKIGNRYRFIQLSEKIIRERVGHFRVDNGSGELSPNLERAFGDVWHLWMYEKDCSDLFQVRYLAELRAEMGLL